MTTDTTGHINYISRRTGLFGRFDHWLGNPDWTSRRVLDFGGNAGNILDDPDCPITPGDYWCVDVSRPAIAEGRRRHPDAAFVHYDRYQFEYNPAGTPGLPIPDLGVRFDFILAFSVLTHVGEREAVELVDSLMGLLTEDGALAFTFIDPLWAPPARTGETPQSNLDGYFARLQRWRPGADVEGMRARAVSAPLTWLTLIAGDQIVLGDATPAEKRLWYVNMCAPGHLRALFPHVLIEEPLPPERQHCAILRAATGTGR